MSDLNHDNLIKTADIVKDVNSHMRCSLIDKLVWSTNSHMNSYMYCKNGLNRDTMGDLQEELNACS